MTCRVFNAFNGRRAHSSPQAVGRVGNPLTDYAGLVFGDIYMFESDEGRAAMLELNREYDYSGICDAQGWEKVNGGGKRQRQLEAVKAAYEWHHPINPKTGKPNNRLYVFTKKLSEVTYEDGRKRNGRKPIIPDAKFETLLAHTVQTYGFGCSSVSESETKVLLFTSTIMRGFGFDAYGALAKLRKETERAGSNKLIDTMLSGCVTSKAYAFSIGRIASRARSDGNKLNKEVIYRKNESSAYEVATDELSSEFEEARELWEYILTAGGTIKADGTVAVAAREMASKTLLEGPDHPNVRTANSVVVPTKLLEAKIDQEELEDAQELYFDTVLSAIHRGMDTLLAKEFWGDTYADDSLKDALRNRMARFDRVAMGFGPTHLSPNPL